MLANVSLKKLENVISVLPNTVWGYNITKEEIQACVNAKDFDSRPYAEIPAEDYLEGDLRNYHIRRIAYLVENKASDPIEIDLGVPVLGYYSDAPIIDGNHRLVAAIIRNDKTILAEVSGQLSYAKKMLGIRKWLPSATTP